MAIRELFADRERRRLGVNAPDVLVYELPTRLRYQIIYVMREGLGAYSDPGYVGVLSPNAQRWVNFERFLLKELGVDALAHEDNPQANVETYFLRADALDALSVVEVAFQSIERRVGRRGESECDQVRELNDRFRQNSVGYAFVSGEIVRVDTTYTHDEMVRPALFLLADPAFKGANDEFLIAHQHYREGRLKEAINEALKAFESTMKCICVARGIPYDPKWQAKQLIGAMLTGGVVPGRHEAHLNALRICLESGLPATRNSSSGHGQGAEVIDAPLELATFAIHLAAANIVFLVESHLATSQT